MVACRRACEMAGRRAVRNRRRAESDNDGIYRRAICRGILKACPRPVPLRAGAHKCERANNDQMLLANYVNARRRRAGCSMTSGGFIIISLSVLRAVEVALCCSR